MLILSFMHLDTIPYNQHVSEEIHHFRAALLSALRLYLNFVLSAL